MTRLMVSRLGRDPSHRKHMFRTMVTQLFKHERIKTTLPKVSSPPSHHHPSSPPPIHRAAHAQHTHRPQPPTQHHAAPRSTTQHHAAPRSTTQHHAAPRSTTQHHAAPRSTPKISYSGPPTHHAPPIIHDTIFAFNSFNVYS